MAMILSTRGHDQPSRGRRHSIGDAVGVTLGVVQGGEGNV